MLLFRELKSGFQGFSDAGSVYLRARQYVENGRRAKRLKSGFLREKRIFRRESGRTKLAGEGRDVFPSFSGAKKWFQGFSDAARVYFRARQYLEDGRRAKRLKTGFLREKRIFRWESGRTKLAAEGREVFACLPGAKNWFQGFSDTGSVYLPVCRRLEESKEIKKWIFCVST